MTLVTAGSKLKARTWTAKLLEKPGGLGAWATHTGKLQLCPLLPPMDVFLPLQTRLKPACHLSPASHRIHFAQRCILPSNAQPWPSKSHGKHGAACARFPRDSLPRAAPSLCKYRTAVPKRPLIP